MRFDREREKLKSAENADLSELTQTEALKILSGKEEDPPAPEKPLK